MRTSIIAGAVVIMAVVVGSPAAAAAPEVSQKSCDRDGGSFSQSHGVKSCTTTSVTTVTSTGIYRYQIGSSPVSAIYSGTVRQTSLVETTTTRTQKGNGPVTTTPVGESVHSMPDEWLTCRVDADILGQSYTTTAAPDVCANPENYPLEDLFL